MIDVQIIPATEEHLQMILPDVRQADIDELYEPPRVSWRVFYL